QLALTRVYHAGIGSEGLIAHKVIPAAGAIEQPEAVVAVRPALEPADRPHGDVVLNICIDQVKARRPVSGCSLLEFGHAGGAGQAVEGFYRVTGRIEEGPEQADRS